jgi:hypothetical protein
MNRILISFSLIFIGLTVVSCNPNSEGHSCPENFDNYKEDDFSICYPVDWTVDNSGFMGAVATFKSKETRTSDRGTLFAMNVNLMKQDRTKLDSLGLKNLDQIADFNRKQIEVLLFDAKILKFRKETVNGQEAYRNTMTAEPNGSKLFFEQVFMISDDALYVLTFTCLESESAEIKVLGKRIIETFELKL